MAALEKSSPVTFGQHLRTQRVETEVALQMHHVKAGHIAQHLELPSERTRPFPQHLSTS